MHNLAYTDYDRKMMCTRTTKADLCNGDSGGPLITYFYGTWYLLGVASGGISCGMSNSPQVFTEVAHYHQWIAQTIASNSPR